MIDSETRNELRKLRELIEDLEGVVSRKTGLASTGIRGTLVEGSVIDATNIIGNAQMKDDSIKKAELDYEVVRVTISNGSADGTGTATSGSVILGFIPISGFAGAGGTRIITISISGTTVTVTLDSNSNGDTVVDVFLMKA